MYRIFLNFPTCYAKPYILHILREHIVLKVTTVTFGCTLYRVSISSDQEIGGKRLKKMRTNLEKILGHSGFREQLELRHT